MTEPRRERNGVRAGRLARGWSQEELAGRAEISRAAVSAVENGRLVPSVAAAMAMAGVLGSSVEDLFGFGEDRARRQGAEPEWAWSPPSDPCRYWRASVGGRDRLYPVEATASGVVAHDGLYRDGACRANDDHGGDPSPAETLVMACCDPAAGLLAAELARASGFRLLVLPRSSGKALSLLKQGLVHVAGVHLATAEDVDGNAEAVRSEFAEGMSLIRVARWEEGLALSNAVAGRSVRSVLRAKLSWVGRESGSGARRCLDQLRPGRRAPSRIARDHRGVAEAVRCGWAEVGVSLRLAAEEAGLRFLGVRVEDYDLCFPSRSEADPRVRSLIRAVRSKSYRSLLAELPGYDVSEAGEIQRLAASADAR